jgi:hypothetical protein
MKKCFILCLVIACLIVAEGKPRKSWRKVGDDPADSWLAYTYSAGGNQIVTWVNATWIVPSYPQTSAGSNAPGWWFGIEPCCPGNGAADLIQPILAYGYLDESSFSIFNGYYQWDNGYWWSSDQGKVEPGNTIYAYVKYRSSSNDYEMFIKCLDTGWSVTSHIDIESGKQYNDVYFVLEHQPDTCAAYPTNGNETFFSINIEMNGKPVIDPKWQAAIFQPACNSQASVLSPSSVAFTWSTDNKKKVK